MCTAHDEEVEEEEKWYNVRHHTQDGLMEIGKRGRDVLHVR